MPLSLRTFILISSEPIITFWGFVSFFDVDYVLLFLRVVVKLCLFYGSLFHLQMAVLQKEMKLFGKWQADSIVFPEYGLADHITVKAQHPLLPHTAGRYQVKRFRKTLCPIVERVCNSLMMHGRNNGKKIKAMNILKHTFEIIHILTNEVIIISTSFRLVPYFVSMPYFLPFEFRTQFRCSLTPSSTAVPVKTLHVLVVAVLFVAKPLMFHHCAVLARPFTSCALVPARPHSVT